VPGDNTSRFLENVIGAGRVAETGTHDELLAADGLYAAMWVAFTGSAALAG
jgi:hypothetical protein